MTETVWPGERDRPRRVAQAPLVSLHFLRAALRRCRRRCLSAAAVGFVLGAAYPIVLPAPATATTTLMLAHDPGKEPASAMLTDVTLLQTREVARESLSRLRLPETVDQFAKSVTATSLTDQVLQIQVTGATPAAAIHNAGTVAAVYLDFRARQLQQQTDTVIRGEQATIAVLQAQIDALSATISSASGANTADINDLIQRRAQAAAQVSTLQQNIQGAQLQIASVVGASHVLDPAYVGKTSRAKGVVLDAASGAIGLGTVAVLVTLVAATMSSRVRRRADVAALVGAPVRLSVARPARRRATVTKAVSTSRQPPAAVQEVVATLQQVLRESDGAKTAVAIVPVGDASDAAAAGAWLAIAETRRGFHVLLVDLSDSGAAARLLGQRGTGLSDVPTSDGTGSLRVLRPAEKLTAAYAPWSSRPSVFAVEPPADEATAAVAAAWRQADVVVTVASVVPRVGADHLSSWATQAVVTLRSGESNAERVHSTAEMLRAAGLTVAGAVLFAPDPSDDSVGLTAADLRHERRVGQPGLA